MKTKLIAMIISVLFMGGTGAAVVHNNSNNNNNTPSKVIEVSQKDCNINEDTNLKEDNAELKEEVLPSENTSNNINEDISVNEEKINDSEKVNDAQLNETTKVQEDANNVNTNDNSSSNNGTSLVEDGPKKETSKQEEVTKKVNTESNDNKTNKSNTQKAEASDAFIAQVEQSIYNKVNEERAKNGLGQLSYNTTMQKYARIKSQDMGDNNYFDHKDLSGNLITAKMQNDGVSYNAWGENIAYISGVSDAEALASQFMTNWMNSSGHRANILSTNFSSIGVGVYKVGNRVYATQEFYR